LDRCANPPDFWWILKAEQRSFVALRDLVTFMAESLEPEPGHAYYDDLLELRRYLDQVERERTPAENPICMRMNLAMNYTLHAVGRTYTVVCREVGPQAWEGRLIAPAMGEILCDLAVGIMSWHHEQGHPAGETDIYAEMTFLSRSEITGLPELQVARPSIGQN